VKALFNIALVAALVCLASSTWAQQEQQVQPQQPQQQQNFDQTFVRDGLLGGLMEVKLARLAVERATNPDVKRFAQKLAENHTAANRELMPIANQFQIQAPREMTREHLQMWQKMSNLRGADFDLEFIRLQIEDHQNDIAKFEKAQNSANPQVKAFATKTLPTLREHLKMAQDIKAKLGQGGTQPQQQPQRRDQ
jgi:putative membrane protein